VFGTCKGDHPALARKVYRDGKLMECGRRRGEAPELASESIHQREEHWVVADLIGKTGRIRTVPMPECVKTVHHAVLATIPPPATDD
jgi:hypothetical protein